MGYDAVGNLVQSIDRNMTAVNLSSPGNQLTTDGAWNYSYDNNGNLISQVGVTGGPDAGLEIDYAYDFRDRLIEGTNLDSSRDVTQEVDYVYDVFNDLVGRTQTNNTYSGGVLTMTNTTTSHNIYDGGNLVLTTGNSGNVTGRELFGPAVDQILAQ